MNTSFTPAGTWFVFDAETGATLKTGLRDKTAAIYWIVRQRAEAKQSAKG